MGVAIVQVSRPDDALLLGMHALMDRTFAPHERDTVAVTRAELRDHPGRFLVFIAVDDANDTVVGYATGALLPLLHPGGEPVADTAFLCGCHLDRDRGYRGQQLGERLAAARLQAAQQQAAALGVRFAGYLAECSDKEGFFNRVTARRLYLQTHAKRYVELPYYQPPSAWSRDGAPIVQTADGERPFAPHSAPQHLMFAPPPGQQIPETLPAVQLLAMVRGMFWYNCRENGFLTDGTPEALVRLHQTVNAFEDELTAALATAQTGCVRLLSKAERATLIANGACVVDHCTAMAG